MRLPTMPKSEGQLYITNFKAINFLDLIVICLSDPPYNIQCNSQMNLTSFIFNPNPTLILQLVLSYCKLLNKIVRYLNSK